MERHQLGSLSGSGGRSHTSQHELLSMSEKSNLVVKPLKLGVALDCDTI